MCEKPSRSSATERRIVTNGLSVSAQSPINPLSMTLPSGPAESLPSATAWTGVVESETADCQTPASTFGLCSSGSQNMTQQQNPTSGQEQEASAPKQTYWLEEKRTQDWLETTVYKQDLKRAHYWAGRDTAFSDWTPRHKPLIEGLFSAELAQGLTIGDAARLLRAKREESR